MDDDFEIVLPPRANQSAMLDFGLVALTEAIAQVAPDTLGGGVLGGEFGYGANYENDVFVMRTYYWGDCDCGYEEREDKWSAEHRHAPTCYQAELQAAKREAGLSYWDSAKREFVWVDSPPGSYDADRAKEDGIYKRLTGKYGLSMAGCAVHCTCGHHETWVAWLKDNDHRDTCALELPNFRHKATGLEVRWYKWIGRDMEAKMPDGVSAADVFRECVESVRHAQS